MDKNSSDWIRHLNLTPHPEGGYFRETYRNEAEISGTLKKKYVGKRNLATSIYFLLDKNQVSKLHKLTSDEIWYYHLGSQVLVHVFYEGKYTGYYLGKNFDKGEVLQVFLPEGSIFGAEVIDKNSFSLFGCMVSPGFHFDDFELISYQQALSQYPEYSDLIKKLS